MNKPSIVLSYLGGYCPVQAEGTMNAVPFYFRARGNRWTFALGGDDLIRTPKWFYNGNYENAGWMSHEEARRLIEETCQKHCSIRLAQKMTEPSNGWKLPFPQCPDYSDIEPPQ
jgi:hypothetical protein